MKIVGEVMAACAPRRRDTRGDVEFWLVEVLGEAYWARGR